MSTAKKGGRVRGVVAFIRWGYLDAARLEGYEVKKDAETGAFSLRGRILPGTYDAFKMRQRPLRLVAPFRKPNGEAHFWEWIVASHEISADGSISAALEVIERSARYGSEVCHT